MLPFARLATRVDQAILARLADVEVWIDGVLPPRYLRGMYSDDYQSASVGTVGMASSQPAVQVDGAALPHDVVGRRASIGDQEYIIAAAVPDGGLTTLVLEAAQ